MVLETTHSKINEKKRRHGTEATGKNGEWGKSRTCQFPKIEEDTN